jgi:hypothetical protein
LILAGMVTGWLLGIKLIIDIMGVN